MCSWKFRRGATARLVAVPPPGCRPGYKPPPWLQVWLQAPPLVAGLVTSKRVSFLSQLRRISPHNAHKWHNTFIGHNSTQHTHRAQQHTTHSQGTAAARRSAEANTAPPSSSNPRSAFQRNWKSSPPRFPSGADERERPLVTSQALDPETKGRNSVFANTQVISCVMFE